MKEIINHRPALQIPPVDLTVAPGGLSCQHHNEVDNDVNAMAARGRNQPQPQALQGADPGSCANTADDAEQGC